LNINDFDVALFFIPKLSAILVLSEFEAVVYVRLFILYYFLFGLLTLFGSFVTHEPILFKKYNFVLFYTNQEEIFNAKLHQK
jgi:hypothetical protein